MNYFGLVKKKEVWGLTLRGWIVSFICFGVILTICIFNLHSFLAISKPVNCEIMAIEGWLPDYALEKVIHEFKTNNYRLLVVTGGPIEQGHYLIKYKSYAEIGAATLKKLGFDEKLVLAVPAPSVERDRTYASAKALKKWLISSGLQIRCINLYSLGAHSRRSWLLFEKALGYNVTVGVVSIDDLSYDPRYWWKCSDGVRDVIDETIAYLYARFFFYSYN